MKHKEHKDGEYIELQRYDAVAGSSVAVKVKKHVESESCTPIWVCLHKGEGLLGGDIAYCWTCKNSI